MTVMDSTLVAEPTSSPSPTPALFDFPRPSKKRNYIRRRDNSSPPPPSEATTTTASITTALQSTALTSDVPPTAPSIPTSISPAPPPIENEADEEDGGGGVNLASILRQRKKYIRLKQGLDIAEIVPKVSRDSTTPGQEGEGGENGEEEDPKKGAAEQELAAVVNRFTHQTGQVLDVDKHMVAYIESEMEKRRRAHAGLKDDTFQFNPPSTINRPSSISTPTATSGAFWQPTRPADRCATLGRLHEVDLGEENKLRNIHRTAEATKRLEGGGSATPETEEANGGGKKKGFRRRRRNSQDIQRDRLVEEVLKESKLELYDEPNSNPSDQDDDEGAADDRIAEKFRKEFLDALLARRRRRGAYHKSNKKKDDGKKPRGPKLGGSRSARAAMRESQMREAASGGGIRK